MKIFLLLVIIFFLILKINKEQKKCKILENNAAMLRIKAAGQEKSAEESFSSGSRPFGLGVSDETDKESGAQAQRELWAEYHKRRAKDAEAQSDWLAKAQIDIENECSQELIRASRRQFCEWR